jgi:uncharacterized protein (DUF486 family)
MHPIVLSILLLTLSNVFRTFAWFRSKLAGV